MAIENPGTQSSSILPVTAVVGAVKPQRWTEVEWVRGAAFSGA